VLIALGLKTTIAHADEPLRPETAFALVGGLAIYLLAHVAFRYRNVHTVNKQRLVMAALLLALVPFGDEVDALPTLAVVTSLMVALITYEAVRFAEGRDRVRHGEGTATPS
jgi:low temperature requirement protein LtrA